MTQPTAPADDVAPRDSRAVDVEQIRVRGARVHNLKNLDVDIPRDRLVVITGPSGSGKSSLAFDTLHAEGQRQYVESLSVYARQFLDQLQRPDVDLIEGLQPTISIDQGRSAQNPRSTVATITEVYDYLRLLMARTGTQHCYRCGRPIAQQSPEEILDALLALSEGTKAMLMAPLVAGRRGRHPEALDAVRKAGFVRVRVDGEVHELDQVPELEPRKVHDIEAVVDRIILREGVRPRLAESLRLALKHGEGMAIVSYLPGGERGGQWQDRLFSTLSACGACKLSFEPLEPRSFSFNSPYGACPDCQGLGAKEQFDPELVIPEESLSLAGGAIAPWRSTASATARKHQQQLEKFAASTGADLNVPVAELKPVQRRKLWHGDGKKFIGLAILLEKEYATTTRAARQERLATFRGRVVCDACGGARLRPEARACRLRDLAIHEMTALTVGAAREFFGRLTFPAETRPVGKPLVAQIMHRLEYLENVGVEYLTLDRSADTLSGGEMQRVRLATSIGSGLVGICYLLDEPSIGLHPRDNQRLIDALRNLTSQGNTVVVVEHDPAMMRQSDHIIDIGPGAGQHGGRAVAAGTPDEVAENPDSITGGYLSGRLEVAVPAQRRRAAKTRAIELGGATTNNLQNADVRIPLGVLACVTGVSGSGKSSLVIETLAKAVAARLGTYGAKPGAHTSLRGVSQLDRLVVVDQSPIGRTPRSNAATYTGALDEIRKVFAETKESKQRGYRAGRFSFNVKGGRCETCQGNGVQRIEMNFLPDLYVTCPVCRGARYNRQTLSVRYKGHSIADVLDMRIDDAVEFFENFPIIHRLLVSLQEVGLGYLTLGQPSTTLSGGEAQRIKLATELGRAANDSTLYILDEPTTGLHYDDVRQLLVVLNRLVDLGSTVLVIEHNLDVIKSADWIIDLGPEGGAEGGRVVATGTPEEFAAQADNHTGRFLRPLLGGSGAPDGEGD
jgi:excinuclease ABC subunit A